MRLTLVLPLHLTGYWDYVTGCHYLFGEEPSYWLSSVLTSSNSTNTQHKTKDIRDNMKQV